MDGEGCKYQALFTSRASVLCFFPRPVTRVKHGASYRGQNYIETMWRETNITSSYREVQVTEGKITVNV